MHTLLRFAFATPTVITLSLLRFINSLTHYTKGTLSYYFQLLIMFTISRSFHFLDFFLYFLFHLSFTVLVHYQSYKFMLSSMVGHRYSNKFLLSSFYFFLIITFPYWTFTFSCLGFPPSFQSSHNKLFLLYSGVRSPLLAESLLISFPSVTEMFHFTEFLVFLWSPLGYL